MSIIRALTPDDAPTYVSLRREMLLDSPWSFCAAPETDRGSNIAIMTEDLGKSGFKVFGAFEHNALRAVAGMIRETNPKFAHIVTIWGVYCTPSARRRGLARAVVSQAIAAARTWSGVARVRLAVSSRAPGAQRLYESLGFEAWGTEPDSVRIDGSSYAEIHMSLRLNQPRA